MVVKILKKFELIAILRDIQPEDAIAIVQTLVDTGIDKIEVSLSNKEIGYQTLKVVLDSFGDQLSVGVGTVTTIEQVDQVVKMGVDFVITPAFDHKLVEYCVVHNIDILPGVFTPSDVMSCLNLGIRKMKMFPANVLGFEYIKALKGPFPAAQFVAVGGVDSHNVHEFLENGFVGVAPGSDLVKRGATKNDLELIRLKAETFVKVCS